MRIMHALMELLRSGPLKDVRLERVVVGACIAIPLWACIAIVMMFVPLFIALWSALIGVALLMIGQELEYRWCAFAGGLLAFGSVFAWAVRQ